MVAHCITMFGMSKNTHIMVRCESKLRERLESIAVHERRKLSDLARIIFEDYVAAQEHALGLVKPVHPKSAHEIKTAILGHKARRKSGNG